LGWINWSFHRKGAKDAKKDQRIFTTFGAEREDVSDWTNILLSPYIREAAERFSFGGISRQRKK
jgi:hypothetical protein